ncbi:hypothetical protein Q1695_010847 [Nippostrongylus brasiliensis]|nr:hypothetical protein Q1695_010847 [Nippostrongylus brasiliensis]
MTGSILTAIVVAYLFANVALAQKSSETADNPFSPDAGLERRRSTKGNSADHRLNHKILSADDEEISWKNGWGFVNPEDEADRIPSRLDLQKAKERLATTTPLYEEVDPNHNGFLKDIGTVNVGFGVGVGVPGNDPVRVGARVGVGLGDSGLAGQLPIGQDIFPRQGEWQSLNDYDGNKANIVPDRARKYWTAVRDGRIRIPHYRPATSLVGVGGNVGVGG